MIASIGKVGIHEKECPPYCQCCQFAANFGSTQLDSDAVSFAQHSDQMLMKLSYEAQSAHPSDYTNIRGS